MFFTVAWKIKANAFFVKQTKAKKADNVNVNDNVNDTDNVNDIDNDNVIIPPLLRRGVSVKDDAKSHKMDIINHCNAFFSVIK